MEEKKKYIKELIEALDLPLPPEETDKHLKNLSEEELDKLIASYESIRDYEQSVAETAREVNPEEYEKINKRYKDDLRDLEAEYDNELKLNQKHADEKLEEKEKWGETELSSIVEDTEHTMKEVSDINEDLSYAIKSIKDENTSK